MNKQDHPHCHHRRNHHCQHLVHTSPSTHLPAVYAGDAVKVAVHWPRGQPTLGLIDSTRTAGQAAVMAWVDALIEGLHVVQEARTTTRNNGFESHERCGEATIAQSAVATAVRISLNVHTVQSVASKQKYGSHYCGSVCMVAVASSECVYGRVWSTHCV